MKLFAILLVRQMGLNRQRPDERVDIESRMFYSKVIVKDLEIMLFRIL